MNLFANVRLWSGFPAIVLYTVVLTLSACEATRDESVRQSHSALAAVGAAQNGVDEGTLAPESAALLPAGASTVAFVSPTGLIASTGNLYWTSSELNEFGADSATVWRAMQNPPETPTKSPEAAQSALDNRVVRVAELAGGLRGGTFNCHSPPICPAGRKCCEPDDNAGCRVCVPINASCP